MEDYQKNYDQLLFYEWMMVVCCIRCSAVSRYSNGWARGFEALIRAEALARVRLWE